MTQTVLAIDDSPDIHDLLEVRLRPEGLRLQHALGAAEGFRKAVALQPDLILLDVDMPGQSGFELCQQFKADPSTALLPIIFLTGASQTATKVRGFDLGGVDYVTKPFDPAELRARVRAALRTKRYQDLLSARAQVDALTGLRNRAYFDERLALEVGACQRYQRRVSLVMIDLDHFKSLNDSFGHPFGDQVLQRTGEILTECVRSTDAACRYGGEEFAIILPETEGDHAVLVAERIRQQFCAAIFQPRGQRVVVTASLGIAEGRDVCPDTRGVTCGLLLAAADDALYAAKRGGRNRVARAPAGRAADLDLPRSA